VVGGAEPVRGSDAAFAFGHAVTVEMSDRLQDQRVHTGTDLEHPLDDHEAFGVGEPPPLHRARRVHRSDGIDHSVQRGQDRLVQIRWCGDRHTGNARPDHRQSDETQSSTR